MLWCESLHLIVMPGPTQWDLHAEWGRGEAAWPHLHVRG